MDSGKGGGYGLSMRRLGAVSMAGVSALLLGGCWLVPVARTEVCADWVRFDTMQQRYDHAGAVVVGVSLKRDGEVRIYDYQANVHVVEVEQVLKGKHRRGSARIASMPVTCGETYPDGDPLDNRDRQLLFLTESNDGWFTMSPDQGSAPFPKGTALPFDTD